MPLFKLCIAVSDLAVGQAASRLIEDLAEPPLAVTLFEQGPPRFIVEAYFAAPPALNPICALLTQLGAGIAMPSLEEVPDENWVALSQASLPPIAAERFIVHGSHDRPRFALRRLAVEIEAGEAFGSGHNATTALCLEALDVLARRRTLERVLDLGCGSGVLAIAAARVAPAARVIAVDNDPIAVAVARENAQLNRVSGRVRVLQAAGFGHPALRAAKRFDLILANILPGPLVALAPEIRRTLQSGGAAILSGILAHQAREVSATYRTQGFRLARTLQRDGWTALVLKRCQVVPSRSMSCRASATMTYPSVNAVHI